PFAGQQPLRFEAAEQRVECAFLDPKAGIVEHLAKRVAVALHAKRGEDREPERAAPQLHLELLVQILVDRHAVRHILCDIHCMTYSIKQRKRKSSAAWNRAHASDSRCAWPPPPPLPPERS